MSAAASPVFEPLRFRTLELPNRVLRSSLAGRFNSYDGMGTPTHVNWDLKFARGGVGAIISSNAPVHPRGLIVPNYAHIDRDETIPFWRDLVRRVHEHDCQYIVQLAFSGRQRDLGGIQFEKGWSSTSKPEPIHGLECERMTVPQIQGLVRDFAAGARRAREAGADGIEIHGCNGYLITQFLSPAINDRKDEYGGSLENRARFALEIVRAIREEVGPDYHMQFKITGADYGNDLFFWQRKGTPIEESVQVCRWLEEAGVDGFHVSSGSSFPHPRNPAGDFPVKDVVRGYDTMISSGRHTFRNFLVFRTWPLNRIFRWAWERPAKKRGVEGINLADTRGDQGSRVRAGRVHGRVPDALGGRGRDPARRLRRRHHRPPADREPGSRAALARGPRPAGAAVHLLEQVPHQPAREPARLLRRVALRLARGHGARHPLRLRPAAVPLSDLIFSPLRFRNLELANRVLRSSVSGRFDDYDGAGTQTRINWEMRFARGGVGAIVSAWCGVTRRGLIVPGYASIESDARIPFWRELGRRVHEHGVPYILQLAHAGRQRDIRGIEFQTGLSSTGKRDPLHGFEATRATPRELRETVEAFGAAAHRAREAGLDGVEIHGANGYLFTQFLSSATNDRRDDYGGPLENRARLLLDALRAVRARVGDDFHVQVKLSVREAANAFLPWLGRGNRVEESVQVCRWLEEAGADAIHISAGSTFPHPLNPAGALPLPEVWANYDGLISSGRHVFRNYLLYRTPLVNRLMQKRWDRDPEDVEGMHLPESAAVKRVVSIPVICTGGFQTASVVRRALEDGACDAVSIARPLMANPDLLAQWQAGRDRPERPCTFSQQVPLQPPGEPARLLRREPLRLPRGDAARDLRGLRPAGREPDRRIECVTLYDSVTRRLGGSHGGTGEEGVLDSAEGVDQSPPR